MSTPEILTDNVPSEQNAMNEPPVTSIPVMFNDGVVHQATIDTTYLKYVDSVVFVNDQYPENADKIFVGVLRNFSGGKMNIVGILVEVDLKDGSTRRYISPSCSNAITLDQLIGQQS